MQAIARVNRVFRDKPGGLVVDYLGLAHELKRALATYTESGGTGKTALDQAEAVAVMWKSTRLPRSVSRLRLFRLDRRDTGRTCRPTACSAGTYFSARERQGALPAGRA